jgi:predicted alpha/beta superfamily hydrolase/TolA-binding protein
MMKNYRIIFVYIFLSIMFFYSGQKLCFAQKDGDDVVIGKYSVIHSQVLDEDRLLLIHLPREYGDTQLSYPVLYLLYGQQINEYFAEAAIITEKLGEPGEIPPVIVIGVANTNRYRDLLPVKIRGRSDSGGADNFLRFFEEELIPYVDKNYRTKNFRILAGPQAGAVFGLYSLITKPGLFHAILSENPFMNPENSEFLYPRAELFFKNTESLKNFLYIKCEKNERPQDLEYAEKFSKLLESEKPDGFRYKVEFREPSGYFIAPLPFREGLRELFAGHKLPENFQTNTVKDIIHYYEKLSGEYGFAVDPPSLMLTFEGDKLSQPGKIKEAIELFEYQLSLYPKSLNAIWRLGEIYRGMGEFEKAKDYYRTFLDIRDMDAAMIRQRLNQVERMISGSAAYRIEQELRKNGIQAGLKKFKEIRSGPRSELYFEESEFNAMGYRLMGAGKMKAAIEIFKLNVELYPESANVYDSLAEAYMNSGDTRKAIKNYKKSLELNPDNNNAKEMLKKLEKK